MAGVKTSLNFEDVQLAAASTWKSIVAVKAPTNQCVKILSFGVFGEGIAGDAKPIEGRWTRITAGSGTATAETPKKTNSAMGVTVQATGRINFTGAPTESPSATYLYPFKVHPQGSILFEKTFADFLLDGGDEVALEMKIPSGGVQINVSGHIELEE